jgi:ParB family transcriptional regulator, chromosome partitioning protein
MTQPRQKEKRTALGRSILGLVPAGEMATAEPGPSAADGGTTGIVSTALALHKAGLAEKLATLEAERATETAAGNRLLELDPALIDDRLPPDRDIRAYSDAAYASLKASLAIHGQHVPILVRPALNQADRYEIAAGRRRLAACRELEQPVLARVLQLSDEAMLALQYRENAEREDITPFERGRWFLHLAETQGLSTTQLAALSGLSQPMIVEYQKLARLPEELVRRLTDPRELSLADGRRLYRALEQTDALAHMIAALDGKGRGLPTKAQLSLLRTSIDASIDAPSNVAGAKRGRILVDAEGQKVGVLTQSGAQWVCRFAKEIDPDAVSFIADQIPKLLAEWQSRS